MAAIAASSISTPGAITLELPGSSRWDTTTARRDFRAASSRGSRPYGAKARQDRPSARGAFHPGSRPRSGSSAQVCSRSPQHERESFFECHDRLRILQSLLGARGRRDSSCLREIAPETTNLAVRSSNLFGRAHSVRSCSPNVADTALNHATRSSRASPIRLCRGAAPISVSYRAPNPGSSSWRTRRNVRSYASEPRFLLPSTGRLQGRSRVSKRGNNIVPAHEIPPQTSHALPRLARLGSRRRAEYV
jgi:hypothetical protein